MSFWLVLVIAYLLGSIPFGLLIARVAGHGDIRNSGSGNIGAANVLRSVGRFAGILTLLLDAAKGFLAVWIALRVSESNIRWMMAVAVAAVVGHVFPAWLNFHGGKGVATALGVFILVCPAAVGAAIALWILVAAFWRYSSLGSIVAAAALPVFVYFLYAPGHAPPDLVTFGTVLIALIVLFKHRSNIERLIAGTENRLHRRR